MKIREVLKVNCVDTNCVIGEFLLFTSFALRALVLELPLARWQRQKERQCPLLFLSFFGKAAGSSRRADAGQKFLDDSN